MKTTREHLSKDPHFRPLIEKVQLPDLPPLTEDTDVYLGLVRSIIYQQLSGKAATTIHNRFLDLFPDRYPHPDLLLGMETEQLRAVGLSGQKANYVRHIADFARTHPFNVATLQAMSDEEVVTYLTSIKGVRPMDGGNVAAFYLATAGCISTL